MNKVLVLNKKVVRITNLPDTRLGRRYLKVIEDVCSNKGFSWLYPKVEFKFDKSEKIPYIINSEVLQGKYVVYLNPFMMNNENTKKTIIHELFHIYQYSTSLAVKEFTEKQDRFSAKVNQMFSKSDAYKTLYLYKIFFLRRTLRMLLCKICLEGQAKFFENSNSFNILKKLMFKPNKYGKSTYFNARIDTIRIKRLWSSSLKRSRKVVMKENTFDSVLVFLKKAFRLIYNIGEHVTFMLVVEGGHTVQQVSKMRIFKQIKEYEELCVKKGIKPLVSVKSGRGALDYITMLIELRDVYKELKAKYKSGEKIPEKRWWQFWK